MEALPFTVESVHKDSELVGTGIMSIRDLHLELNMIGKERIARDARSTISAKLALNKAKISAEAYQKPRDLVTYEFGEVRNKSSMTTVHLKAPEYHPIGPFDTLQLEVFVKSPLATVKRTSSATPKMFQWVKKTKKTQSHMELDLPGDSMSVDKLLGEASLSVLSILNNLDTTHGFSSQFRSTNNCLLLKPYTYKARVTVYVKDAFKEGWLDVQKNTPTRIQQWELCYAVLSGTNFSLFREPPSEGKVAVPMETLNLLQIKVS
ncbi:hypothetical protein SARC_01571 [Sphaeroforma arctica JP610]|uniref:Uncharacterized protein n=1 Tax=Sphaeroforma arctica JP610 TaxID=667725 RepID=A0A0L0GBG2_9EUKA|nr:hypothetical protein SARC_01571 [Sphaeroforma arctica JP610]KNC86249.1 hypothetical protein SARC_01571 [Sphaeroforma arctica JP610]|eukprot:XP_014160151.1 hypothetical protein SARC_01571 [Sphaeroforma arctica JP610]